MYPTPYWWTDEDDLTHVFYDNHMPPSDGFGWTSLCEDVHLPVEGEQFELEEDVTAASVTCGHCRDDLAKPYIDPEDEDLVSVRGCLVRIQRDADGMLTTARRVCRGSPLHYELAFEPESFTGHLREQAATVCEECWQTYVDHQWSGDVEGGELRVEWWAEDGPHEYYAKAAEAVRTGPPAKLQLTSENGLQAEIPRDDIAGITLTAAQHVDY